MDKKTLIEEIKNFQATKARNSMGCSENWYNFYFAMKCTFTLEEIENMTEREIELLEKLHNNVSEGLY